MPPRKTGRYAEMITPQQFADETGLPLTLVRSIFRRVPRQPQPTRRIVVRRADLDRVLRDDAPSAYPGGTT